MSNQFKGGQALQFRSKPTPQSLLFQHSLQTWLHVAFPISQGLGSMKWHNFIDFFKPSTSQDFGLYFLSGNWPILFQFPSLFIPTVSFCSTVWVIVLCMMYLQRLCKGLINEQLMVQETINPLLLRLKDLKVIYSHNLKCSPSPSTVLLTKIFLSFSIPVYKVS